MQTVNKNLRIGISGLGLIGGSLYKCLKDNGFSNLCAYTHNADTRKQIENDGYAATDDINILEHCDLIFVCVPISQTVSEIQNIFSINKSAIYADVASLKENILVEINKLNGCKFIGSHPMAGTENSGFNASFANLFEGAKWVITPSENVNDDDISILKAIINITKAIIVKMDAKEHDNAVALISHAPMLISQSLMNAVLDNNEAKLLASGGFRDMTRLAMSNKVMAKDMLQLNSENIKGALTLFIDNANKLLNDNYFDSHIDDIINCRKNLYDFNGKNIFKNND